MVKLMASVQETPLINRAVYKVITLFADIIIAQEITSTMAKISREYFRPMKVEKIGVNKFPVADPRSDVEAIHDP